MATDPARTARYLIQGAGLPSPRTPPYAELVELARAYLALVDGSTALSTEPWYVPTEAAVQYAAAVRPSLSNEAARRELAELLLTARPVQGHSDLWRARRRSSGLDVSVRAERQGGLLVVQHVSVRRR